MPTTEPKPWNLWADTRTNAELRERWAELHRQGTASRTPAEAALIARAMDDVAHTLHMRQMRGIGDGWRHPHADDPRFHR